MKKHLLKLVVLTILTFSLVGCGSTGSGITGDPPVKKSVSNICHEEGSTYYDQTKEFTSYSSIEECLKSGRLPKR